MLKDVYYLVTNNQNMAIDSLATLFDIAENEPNFLKQQIKDLITMVIKIC